MQDTREYLDPQRDQLPEHISKILLRSFDKIAKAAFGNAWVGVGCGVGGEMRSTGPLRKPPPRQNTGT